MPKGIPNKKLEEPKTRQKDADGYELCLDCGHRDAMHKGPPNAKACHHACNCWDYK